MPPSFVALTPATSGWGCWRPWSWAADGPADVVHQRHAEGRTGHQRHRPVHVRPGALSACSSRSRSAQSRPSTGFQPVKIPLLGDIPFIGRDPVSTTACWSTARFCWCRWPGGSGQDHLGCRIKAVGQNPAAADSLGVSVDRVRYVSVCLGAMLAGLAGASLSHRAGQPVSGEPDRRPGLYRGGAGLFRRLAAAGHHGRCAALQPVNAFQLWMQVLGVKIPSGCGGDAALRPDDRGAWPSRSSRVRQPAALNKPFERGESSNTR